MLLHHDLVAHFRQCFLPDTLDRQQLIRAGKATLAIPKIDDRLGRFRANPVQCFQFGHIGSIQIDGTVLCLRPSRLGGFCGGGFDSV